MPQAAASDTPVVFVLFGITGDLARRKILPALAALHEQKKLKKDFRIIGVSRSDISPEHLYAGLADSGAVRHALSHKQAQFLRERTTMVRVDPAAIDDYYALLSHIEQDASLLSSPSKRIYYLAVPGGAFCEVVSKLGESGHAKKLPAESADPIILVEKPFGLDVSSARLLIEAADRYFDESQVYRIDHYIAKETAQNIMAFRFQNPIFGSVWDSEHIESIDVKMFEQIGIEGRTDFYEPTGALRDIVQSHLLQLLAIVTMERPAEPTSASLHRSKLRLLRSILPVPSADASHVATRGQYASYRQEVDNPASYTETYAKLRLAIDSVQWRGCSLTLETGKAVADTYSEIVVTFAGRHGEKAKNILTFHLQPHEGISLQLQAKQPGLGSRLQAVTMDFDYQTAFRRNVPEAYERVLMDAVRGDQSLFASAEEVLVSWRIVEEVLSYWRHNTDGLVIYPNAAHPSEIVN